MVDIDSFMEEYIVSGDLNVQHIYNKAKLIDRFINITCFSDNESTKFARNDKIEKIKIFKEKYKTDIEDSPLLEGSIHRILCDLKNEEIKDRIDWLIINNKKFDKKKYIDKISLIEEDLNEIIRC